jgi:hypothetical protein
MCLACPSRCFSTPTDLPNELLVMIAAEMSTCYYTLSSFSTTCRRLHNVFFPLLMRKAANIRVLPTYYSYESYLTVLHWASERGYIRVVKAILEAGASVDVLDGHQITALMRASASGHEDVVECLLVHGADFKFTLNGETALTKAAYFNHPRTLNILLRHCGTVDRQHWWTILWAAKRGYSDIARLLIQSGVDVNFRPTTTDEIPLCARYPVGKTALYIAVYNQHASLVTLLMDNGAVNSVDDSGETALQYLDQRWRDFSPAQERCLYELCGRKWWRKMWWKSRRVFAPWILFECLALCVRFCITGVAFSFIVLGIVAFPLYLSRCFYDMLQILRKG